MTALNSDGQFGNQIISRRQRKTLASVDPNGEHIAVLSWCL